MSASPWARFEGAVVTHHGMLVTVVVDGEPTRCAVPPGIEPTPVAGDRVEVTEDGPEGRPTVARVAERRSRVLRLRRDRQRRSAAGATEHVVAANVDLALVTASLARPPFHPRLIDRYMVLCEAGGVTPALVLNKADLDVEAPDLALYEALGLPIVRVSAKTGEGFDALHDLIEGRTVVFTGHSGTGKSSIVNRLTGEAVAATSEVGGKRGQGRHTTTGATLYPLDAQGTAVIDTPGIRSLAMTGLDSEQLARLFPDFRPHLGHCRFNDCQHQGEPGCAIAEAIERGEVRPERYAMFRRLLAEE